MGDLSPHFSRSEFRCRHCGRLVGPDRELVEVLERVRAAGGHRPLPILSGYRCPTHNRAIGGAPKSQHLRGRAADIPGGRITVAQAVAAGARGVGYRNGWVVHLDVRPGRVVTFRE